MSARANHIVHPPIRRTPYYLSSIPTMLRGFSSWGVIAALLVAHARGRRDSYQPARRVGLRRGGQTFEVRTFLELWSLKETLLDLSYEKFGFALPESGVVVDVGAAIGEFTVLAASRTECTVVAIEPNPFSQRVLERNLEANGCGDVRIFAVALAKEDGVALMDLGSDPGTTGIQSGDGPSTLSEVKTTTLSSILDGLGVDRCALLKVDCEGGEYEIFGAMDAATFARIDQIVMEYHDVGGHVHAEIVRLFIDNGFWVDEYPSFHLHLGYLRAGRR